MSSSPHDDDAQVSETSVMDSDGGPQEIQPHDATAADPSAESGKAQEGTAGPNAAPEHETTGQGAGAADNLRDKPQG